MIILDNITNKSGQTDFIDYVIKNYEKEDNPTFVNTCDGWDYYTSHNKIRDKVRKVTGIDAEGRPYTKTSDVLSNTQLTHNFYRKLVNQKVSYVLGRPFTINQTKITDRTKADTISKALEPYLDDTLYCEIQTAAADAIIGGMGWIYNYYKDGKIKFDRIDPRQIIPIWKDAKHKVIDAIIHKYLRYEFLSSGELKKIKCVDYYTTIGRTKYEYDISGKLVEVEKLTAYININGGIYNWDRMPWTWFKYSPSDECLLTNVKSLIDEYDFLESCVSDIIKDSPNSYMVIKGYSAGSIEEFQRNANEYRKLFVQSDGGVDSLETPLQVDQIKLQWEQIRKDIFEFGQGVDTINTDLRDTSGAALRHIYSDLDMDCSKWMTLLKQSIQNILYFIFVDIFLKTGKDYINANFDIIFNTDIVINESETVTNLMNSKDILPMKTLIAQSPYVVNAEEEYEEWKREQQEKAQLEIEVDKATETKEVSNGKTDNTNNT
jgi:SPP1 family phage portal protein